MSTRVLDLLRAGDGAARPVEAVDERAKRELHAELVASLDLSVAQAMERPALEHQLRTRLTEMVRSRALPMTRDQQTQAVEDILDEVLGYGPLQRLLRMPDVSDILVNGPDVVYVERHGQLERVPVRFRDAEHLLHVIDRIVGAVGRRIDESSPMVDARLPDGSRVNACIPPATLDAPVLSIRRFGATPIRREDLLRLGAVPEPVMDLLQACVGSKLNVLVSGGTGSGKTTMLNVLSSFIPSRERVITVEDAAELQLQQEHVIRMETRPPNLEGEGEITARALVRNALRMRPDRIIVGEIRGEEAFDMLQAMNTGHEGSLSTVHANSPRHALTRLGAMVSLAAPSLSADTVQAMIGEAIHAIVHVQRFGDGRRRVVSLTEVNGAEGGKIVTQEIFRFQQRTVEVRGRVRGVFASTGVRPRFADRLEEHGFTVPPEALAFAAEV